MRKPLRNLNLEARSLISQIFEKTIRKPLLDFRRRNLKYLPDFRFEMCITIVLDITGKNNAKVIMSHVSILSPIFEPFSRCIDQFKIFQSWYNASH